MHPLPAVEPTADPAAEPAPKHIAEPAELEDRQVTADEQPKKKACLERESAFKSAPKPPGASTPKSSLEEMASEPTVINGNRVVCTTKMTISVPNTRNLRPHK
ncbi:unnamed protein product [Rhizoctonia solani]|uniref:Uncharacterized protein n=1 Tax=Rhizoctonia solani TaxID=456999 RepID=A0A8H2Y1P3_9AGAM|nr:unnamed protein product [Rhizoctonia solani]CAE6533376.1 unnamed protein product [Rhizoctonia solani]